MAKKRCEQWTGNKALINVTLNTIKHFACTWIFKQVEMHSVFIAYDTFKLQKFGKM